MAEAEHKLRWRFVDTHAGANPASYTFAVNPRQMTKPYLAKVISYQATTASDGRSLAFEGAPAPIEWTFGGNSLTQAQLKAFETWVYKKRTRIYVYDHYGRRYTVYLRDLDAKPPEGRTSPHYPFRMEWTITATLFANPTWPS
jgi:hypothetical protein